MITDRVVAIVCFFGFRGSEGKPPVGSAVEASVRLFGFELFLFLLLVSSS